MVDSKVRQQRKWSRVMYSPEKQGQCSRLFENRPGRKRTMRLLAVRVIGRHKIGLSCLGQMKQFVTNAEDLLLIKNLYKQCAERSEDVGRFKKQGPDYKTILDFIKLGKDRKRHCSYILNR